MVTLMQITLSDKLLNRVKHLKSKLMLMSLILCL